jgi:hypothetical protein
MPKEQLKSKFASSLLQHSIAISNAVDYSLPTQGNGIPGLLLLQQRQPPLVRSLCGVGVPMPHRTFAVRNVLCSADSVGRIQVRQNSKYGAKVHTRMPE